MRDFFKELMRRNVARVALVYVIVAWVTMQVVDVMFPALHVPDWAISITAALILIGFPFALIFAWAFEITPEGIKREKDVDRSDSITTHTGRKLDFMIIGALVIAVAFLLVDKFILTGSDD
ncbi:MAG: adenylyl cyclase, partial [Gammaproteobacteria bacterium]|nr:adenylyl cyclase [Gammaproteobacteria bacterium]